MGCLAVYVFQGAAQMLDPNQCGQTSVITLFAKRTNGVFVASPHAA